MDWIRHCAVAWVLAVALAPGDCLAVDVLFYVPHEDEADLWDEVVAAVWQDGGVETSVWAAAWPPEIHGVTLPDDQCLTWLDEHAASPSIVAYMTDWDEPITLGVNAHGLSHEEVVKVAVILTMSLRRGIAITDGGWVPPPVTHGALAAAPEVTAPVADIEPDGGVDVAVTGDGEVEEVAIEEVAPPPSVPRRRPTVEVGIGAGAGLRQQAATQAVAVSGRLAFRRGIWLGPGFQVSAEFGRLLEVEPYRINVVRTTIAARWQFTPAVRDLDFPLALGLGVSPTAFRLANQPEAEWGTDAPPTALIEAGLRFGLGPGVMLGLRLEAAFDLMTLQVNVGQDGSAGHVELHWFVFTPKLEIIFGPR